MANKHESRAFEQSLAKLADLAQNRVRLDEFTASDRAHLLDLFVNNETTLLKVYEVLFPGTRSFHKIQQLRNPSDLITIGTEAT